MFTKFKLDKNRFTQLLRSNRIILPKLTQLIVVGIKVSLCTGFIHRLWINPAFLASWKDKKA